jgi:hypothetical protein
MTVPVKPVFDSQAELAVAGAVLASRMRTASVTVSPADAREAVKP